MALSLVERQTQPDSDGNDPGQVQRIVISDNCAIGQGLRSSPVIENMSSALHLAESCRPLIWEVVLSPASSAALHRRRPRSVSTKEKMLRLDDAGAAQWSQYL